MGACVVCAPADTGCPDGSVPRLAQVWEGQMGCSCDSGINHPNQYYEESRRVLTERQAEAAGMAGGAGEAADAIPTPTAAGGRLSGEGSGAAAAITPAAALQSGQLQQQEQEQQQHGGVMLAVAAAVSGSGGALGTTPAKLQRT
jgi:hypothetical protein